MNAHALWLHRAAGERRFGVKGARAADILRQLGLNVPEAPNTWASLRAGAGEDSGDVVCRLGNTEFFIEELRGTSAIAALEATSRHTPGVWPVLREDFAMILGGTQACDALAEVCNVDFASLDAARRPVVMTLMAGVAVLVLPRQSNFRIWCDPSFGSYLWETLHEVVSTTNGRDA